MLKLKRIAKIVTGGLETAYDYLYNELLVAVGKFLIEVFTCSATLYYAITNTLPIVPQWAWAGMTVFMIVVGTYSLQELITWGYDEDGNKLPDEEEEEEEGDEIVEDG